MGLKSFVSNTRHKHIRVLSDNTTAIAYVNNMGGIKSRILNDLAQKIWEWCRYRALWLSVHFVPGKSNVADASSRQFNDKIEWQLDANLFKAVCRLWDTPDIDLFASRLNNHLPDYASWKPDPEAVIVDAFSADWSKFYSYAFPPFSLIGRCLQKLREDEGEQILITPLWPTQTWYPVLMNMLTAAPVILPRSIRQLTLPGTVAVHPLHKKLVLIANRISGKSWEPGRFQTRLPVSYLRLGDPELKNNISHSYRDGFRTVVNGRFLQFNRL